MTTNSLPRISGSGRETWREVATAIGLSTGAAVALGFSRFAYGLLLPPMQADLGWSYVEAGALNTANGAGYIVGALAASWAAKRWGAARAFLFGFSVSVVILLSTASTNSLPVFIALRTVGGMSTALTFILGAGLAAAICPSEDPRRRGTLVGLYVAAVGVGVLLAGAAIPIALQDGVHRWPLAWIALSVLGAAGLPAAWWAARGVPDPVGGSVAILEVHELRQLAPTFVGYGLFGAGYVGYMTFIVALLERQGSSPEQLIWFWSALGLVSAVSTLLWGRTLGAFRGGRGPALVYAAAMLGTLPVLFHHGPTAMFVSAFLFGGSFLAGPAAITIVAQRQLPASSWTAAISLLTVGFAFGQTIGPIVGGAISDAVGSIATGFWASPVLLGAAACASLLQRSPAESR